MGTYGSRGVAPLILKGGTYGGERSASLTSSFTAGERTSRASVYHSVFQLMPWNSEWKSGGCRLDYSTLNLLRNKVAWNLTNDVLEFSHFVVCRFGSRHFRIDNMLYWIKRR